MDLGGLGVGAGDRGITTATGWAGGPVRRLPLCRDEPKYGPPRNVGPFRALWQAL